MSVWDKTPYAENSDNANVTACCLYCTITVDADGRVLHDGGCVGAEIAALRASRVRLATLAVSLLDALEAFGATVPDDPQFVADAEAARRIVREEDDGQ